MKACPILFLAVALFPMVTQSTAQYGDVPVAPKVDVTVNSEVFSLANGYALAFSAMSANRVIIYIRTEERIQKFESIRNVTSLGGVVLIEMRDNSTIVIDPRKIVFMTEGTVKP